MSQGPRVFISYGWENEPYKEWVQGLAARLRTDGVHARLDVWDRKDGQAVTGFLLAEVEDADCVLVLASPGYVARIRAVQRGEGLSGVGLEWDALSAELFQRKNPAKLVVALTGGELAELPPWLTREPVFELTREATFRQQYDQLLARLTRQRPVVPAVAPVVRQVAQPVVQPIAAGGAAPPSVAGGHPGDGATGVATRQHATEQQLREARAQRKSEVLAGRPTAAVDEQILELRRRQREEGLAPQETLANGRYELVERIGEGGFAVVWKAYDQQNPRRPLVAIKVLHTQFAADQTRRERFFRGARLMAELNHPGIVQVVDRRCEEGGLCYFVMEYLPGGDLRQAVTDRRIRPDQALALGLQIGEALHHAHTAIRGLVHRDVKPANILLDGQGRPKLTDFDLVRAADTTGGSRTGGLGTVVYAAPEMLSRAKDAGVPADIYALAMTLLFVLHGEELPYFELVRRPEGFLQRLACNPEQRKVLLRALEEEPAQRWGSVAEFCGALVAASQPPLPPLPTEPTAAQLHELLWGPLAPADQLRLLRQAAQTCRQLPTLQLLAAALLARNAHPTILAEARQRAGGALALGIPEQPWAKIPAGEFRMGSPATEEGRDGDEGPQHRVRLLRPYHLLATPVTQALYVVVTNTNPSHFTGDLRRPVEQVTWNQAVAFGEQLGRLLGWPVRLPWEAEWEYACRAATTTRYWSGDGEKDLARVGWYEKNSGSTTHPAGELPANPWGLYDVHGNVWEWCLDPWIANYQGREAGIDLDPADLVIPGGRGVGRVVRGGGWGDSAQSVRSAYRNGSDPRVQWQDRGFRVLLPPSSAPGR